MKFTGDTLVKVWLEGTRAYYYMTKRQFSMMRKAFTKSVVDATPVTRKQPAPSGASSDLLSGLMLPKQTVVTHDGKSVTAKYIKLLPGNQAAVAKDVIKRALALGFKAVKGNYRITYKHPSGATLDVEVTLKTSHVASGARGKQSTQINIYFSSAGNSTAKSQATGFKPKEMQGQEWFDKINGKSKALATTEGYWRQRFDKEASSLPFPVPLKVPGYSWSEFKNALAKAQTQAKLETSKGTSPNRWAGSENGAKEYSLGKWRWPAGVTYYFSRGVPPSRAFYKFITGKDNPKLPTYGR